MKSLISGDKYVNGTIIPRPPPIQYGRREGRSFDRRPRVQNRGPMQGDNRNFGPPQNPPSHQNYVPLGGQPHQQNYGMPLNPPTQAPQQNYGPPPQQNYGMPFNPQTQGPQQNYAPQQNPQGQGQYYGQMQNAPPGHSYGQQQNSSPGYNYGEPQNLPSHHGPSFTDQQNYGPRGSNFPGQQNLGTSGAVNNGPTSSSGGWNDYQGGRRDFQQQDQRGHLSPDQRSFGQGQSYPRDMSSNQGLGRPQQDMNPGYGQRYSDNAEEPRFSPGGYGNNMQGGEQTHHNTVDGTPDQVRGYGTFC